MTISRCPKCRESVSIPPGASRTAVVACPLCSEEYLLDDALRTLPPMLVVLSDPKQEAAETLRPAAMMSIDKALQGMDDAIDLKSEQPLLGTPTTPAVPAFNFDAGFSSTPTKSRPSVASRGRAKRKEASAMRLIVQTVGGGAMGLVIAQLILWHLPGKWHANNRDPFGLAAKVAPYAPFLVPASLRGETVTEEAAAPNEPPAISARPNTATASDDSPESKNTPFESAIPDFEFNPTKVAKAKNKEPAKQPTLPGSNPVPGDELKTDEPNVLPAIALESPATAFNPVTEPLPIPDAPGEPAVATAENLATLLSLEKITTEELGTRMKAATEAETAWNSAGDVSREEKQKLFTDFHSSYSQLGATIPCLDRDSSDDHSVLASLRDRLTSISQDPMKLMYIGSLGSRRLKEQEDDGAFLTGTVLKHSQSGKLFETRLRLKADHEVSLLSQIDLSKALPTNANLLVVGKIVREPAKNLAGYYHGSDELVVLNGVHVVIPDATK